MRATVVRLPLPRACALCRLGDASARPVSGGAITFAGHGLGPGSRDRGRISAPLLATNLGRCWRRFCAARGVQTITGHDRARRVLDHDQCRHFRSGHTDNRVAAGVHPPTPVGTQAINQVMVRVLASDGITR